MLDTFTKKRIDDCRDILVGKLPDPKAQIEQITIALIYKFMDDMDKEAIELGGQAKFFADYKVPDHEVPNDRSKDTIIEFSKYAWDNLLNSKVSAAEMLTLYSEAIVGIDKNPNIPQLFRDIFKNAYLPYRDPETLKLFLRTIAGFEYTHSEKLGDAFEYLLQVMGSQGDAGQFRTPRHIIDFLVQVIDPSKSDTILDPACGTAGFLISAFKHIKEKNNDQLTPDERKKLIQNFVGYDISPDMVRLSLVNLYLHGFSDPHIFEYDTLSSEERWDESFDVILANPPFMSPKGGIRPHKKFTIQSKRSEVLFVDYIAEHLNPTGKAGIIVPEGIIFQSATSYKDLRKLLVETSLWAVVSLPSGVFNPYSGVKTSILLLDKALAKKTDEILFIKIDNDGLDLGAQRRNVKGNQLPEALNTIRLYKTSIEQGLGFENTAIAHSVLKKAIAELGDYNLSGERYKETKIANSTWDLIELGQVAEINPKKSEVRDLSEDLFVSFVPMSDVNENQISFSPKEERHLGEVYKGYTFFKNDDVLLAKVTPCFENGKAGIAKNLTNGFGFGSTEFYVLRSNGKVLPEWLYYMTKSEIFHSQGFLQMTGTGGLKRLPKSFVSSFQVPLPPLSVQEEILAEIESYQKIIDGARMVVENYRPQIKIDPDWEMKSIGEVATVNPKKSEIRELDPTTEVSFVPMADLGEHRMSFVPQETKKLEEVYKGYTYFRDNDVLVAKVTPCFENGKAGIAKNLTNRIGFGSSEFIVIRAGDDVYPDWIYYVIASNRFRIIGKNKMTGTGGLKRVPRDFVEDYKIPVPSKEDQLLQIEDIRNQQETAKRNRQLIGIFEQKIKDRISEVWGTNKNEQ